MQFLLLIAKLLLFLAHSSPITDYRIGGSSCHPPYCSLYSLPVWRKSLLKKH
ncbi:hypothetical protein GBAR_LOCUS9866 [Geodia barretti]|uniref:Uncharacterized protein n=1 Tax=Geodia barretti TaxID=519541 RepID=A0AA35R4D9_GEOBA|nr:hypothetical protein GBAR_LOCUS3261 [Geodia barretti]CAI8015995.1 hypothetical protein GBAR_LOCUS9866 [Geodia barretti]